MLPGYQINHGSALDRAKLVKFLQHSYQELFPEQNYAHLAQTVEKYFCPETPLWWVEFVGNEQKDATQSVFSQETGKHSDWVGCLWLGNAIDQVDGDRHAHIFLLYVIPKHRRRGIGTALMRHAESWAKKRGDRKIGLQVFQVNQPAINLYHQLGYQSQSLWMVKPLH